jgi:hypothetical protein
MNIGDEITVYGQSAKIVDINELHAETVIELDHAIVVPFKEYTRDYVFESEVLKK